MANEKRLDLIDRKILYEELSTLSMTVTGLRAGKGVLNDFMNEYRKSVLRIVDDAPTVDAVEVVHGRNVNDTPSQFECSVCHWECLDTYGGDTSDYNYCPNCGAKMDGDGNGT